ncbi:MAG: hypothetical protein GY696_24035 [Gammaproteobacteria bacterium]|nr:hypothetical protein [Gammaproteobacteria bacterium]
MCPKSFPKANALEDHALQNHEQFECEQCPLRFSGAEQLKLHSLSVHSVHPKPRFQCKMCPKSFQKANALEGHILRNHPEDEQQLPYHPRCKTVSCVVCSKPLSRYNYHLHMAKVHTGEKLQYKCHLCCKSFFLPESLKRHNMIVHNAKLCTRGGQVMYSLKCHLCPKVFESISGLKYHQRVHMDLPNYNKCSHCPKAYATSAALRCHLRSAH